MSKKRRPSIKPIELEAARFIGAGDYANLRRFLIEGVDPTAQDGALLCEVVRCGEQGMLKLLLDYQVRIPRSRQAPLLATAVASAAPEVLQTMIKHLGVDATQSALRRNSYFVMIIAGDVCRKADGYQRSGVKLSELEIWRRRAELLGDAVRAAVRTPHESTSDIWGTVVKRSRRCAEILRNVFEPKRLGDRGAVARSASQLSWRANPNTTFPRSSPGEAVRLGACLRGRLII